MSSHALIITFSRWKSYLQKTFPRKSRRSLKYKDGDTDIYTGTVPTTDLQTSPLPLRCGHLDIKDAQLAEKNDGRKISHLVWAPQVPKHAQMAL